MYPPHHSLQTCVKQNALEHASEFPLAVKAVEESFYVDDGLAGADNMWMMFSLVQPPSRTLIIAVFFSVRQKFLLFLSREKQLVINKFSSRVVAIVVDEAHCVSNTSGK